MARPQTTDQLAVFEAWYANGRNTLQTSAKLGIKRQTLQGWIERYGWTDTADRRDAEIARRAERDAIARRAKMIEDQRRIGQALRNAGAQYLQEQGKKSAKSMKDAVAAIAKGFELERQAEGLPDWVGEILNASDDEIRSRHADIERAIAEKVRMGGTGEEEGRLASG